MPDQTPATSPGDAHPTPGIDPDEMAVVMRVLERLPELAPDHPDQIAVKSAANRMYRRVRQAKKRAARQPVVDADNAVLALTATGSPLRIDDETLGIPLVSSVRGDIAGHLTEPRDCYICKRDYTQVDAFYHWLCPECAAYSHARRDQRADLTGRHALLTGGRARKPKEPQ